MKKHIHISSNRPLLVAILLFATLALAAQKPSYVNAVARPGDGVLSLLRLYKLDGQKCNVDYFYKVNGLKEKDFIKANHIYKLPLYSYTYNGKSIRSTIDRNDWNTAKRIQSYNAEMTKIGLRAKDYPETKVLWVPHHELGCKAIETDDATTQAATPPKPATPTKPKPTPKITEKSLATMKGGNGVYPIFGKEFEKVKKVDDKLKNRVYYIVAGHGGPDPGAIAKVGKETICEDEYAYDVSLRLARNLLKHNAIVYVVIRDPNDGIRSEKYLDCDNDEQCWMGQAIPLNSKEKLQQRSTAINELYLKHKAQGLQQQAVMIHVDSRNVKDRIDLFFYHFPGSRSGLKLANTLHKTVAGQYKIHRPGGGYEGTVTGRDLHMLRETKPTAVYVELGNIRNRADQNRIVVENNRQALANWLAKGFLKAAK